MSLEEPFERLGLSRQETAVYLSTLRLGIAKASEIAQKAQATREAVYYTLKLLKEKGFVSEVIRSGVKHYNATSPARLAEIIEEERQQKARALEDALPELEKIRRTAIKRPKIEVYEGIEGFKSIASKLLERENRQFRCYVSGNVLEWLPHFHAQFRRKRKEKNISIRTISERTELVEGIRKLDEEELRETRFNDGLLDGTSLIYYILDDAVVIVKANETEQLGIYIEEENLALLQKNIFEVLWEKSQS